MASSPEHYAATTIDDPQFVVRNRIRTYNLFDPVLSYILGKEYLYKDRSSIECGHSNLVCPNFTIVMMINLPAGNISKWRSISVTTASV